jgi:hypothetical protein
LTADPLDDAEEVATFVGVLSQIPATPFEIDAADTPPLPSQVFHGIAEVPQPILSLPPPSSPPPDSVSQPLRIASPLLLPSPPFIGAVECHQRRGHRRKSKTKNRHLTKEEREAIKASQTERAPGGEKRVGAPLADDDAPLPKAKKARTNLPPS